MNITVASDDDSRPYGPVQSEYWAMNSGALFLYRSAATPSNTGPCASGTSGSPAAPASSPKSETPSIATWNGASTVRISTQRAPFLAADARISGSSSMWSAQRVGSSSASSATRIVWLHAGRTGIAKPDSETRQPGSAPAGVPPHASVGTAKSAASGPQNGTRNGTARDSLSCAPSSPVS